MPPFPFVSSPARLWRRVTSAAAQRPRFVLLPLGVALVVAGLYVLTRPLTSLTTLAVVVGLSAILTGVAQLWGEAPLPLRWGTAVVWIAGGAAVLLWLGQSIELLPDAMAVLLLVGAVTTATRVVRGPIGVRVWHASLAVSQLVLGGLALSWPDATILVVAVMFGARVVLHGGALLWASLRPSVPVRREPRPSRSVGRGGARGLVPWLASAVVLALTGGLAWGSWQLHAGAPVIDAFYSAPGPVPDDPGTLLRDEDWPGEVPTDAVVRRILYTSTDLNGAPVLASALVVSAVDAPDGPRPSILYDHGTTGIARSCAPSLLPDMFRSQAIPALEQALAEGWVVVATDYAGQGTEADFPYLIGEGEARSGLDAVRAAREMSGLDLSEETVVWGHSQGGHAALWTGAIAADYAPEIDVRGVAALAPAGDPLALAERIVGASTNPLASIMVAWVLVPYSRAYPEIELRDHVDPAGRVLVNEMAQRCATEPGLLISVADAMGVSRDRPLFTGDLTTGATGDRLAENVAVGPWPMPLLIAWGSDDEVISAEIQRAYVERICSDGADLVWHEYDDRGHLSVVEPDSPLIDPLVAWTADRLTAEPSPRSPCA